MPGKAKSKSKVTMTDRSLVWKHPCTIHNLPFRMLNLIPGFGSKIFCELSRITNYTRRRQVEDRCCYLRLDAIPQQPSFSYLLGVRSVDHHATIRCTSLHQSCFILALVSCHSSCWMRWYCTKGSGKYTSILHRCFAGTNRNLFISTHKEIALTLSITPSTGSPQGRQGNMDVSTQITGTLDWHHCRPPSYLPCLW
jgi:hypothetical protein